MIEALTKGGKNIFEEVKKGRIKNKECATSIDGCKGAVKISNHFKTQYEELYNQQSSTEELQSFLGDINVRIKQEEYCEVERITPSLIKEIVQSKIKPNKADAVENFNSDCLINGPDCLFTIISQLFKGLATHGFIPSLLLLCAIIPLVKDPSGSLDKSSNYRGIAISSLFLKLWDWIVILLHGESLGSDELQFGFKKSSSTSMCTWSVMEVINYYKRGGSDMFACLLDCKKAFDTVEHVKKFCKLERKIPLIFVRILLVIYLGQRCFVRWNTKDSAEFKVQNGVRQGAVLSPVLFSLYINDLIEILRNTGIGCHIGSIYFGIVAYADDILLLAPRRDALQRMVNISEEFMSDHKISFSTTKSSVFTLVPTRRWSKVLR